MTIVRRLPAAVRDAGVPAAVGLSLLLLTYLPACQNTDDILKPGDLAADLMRAVYVPDSVFALNPIELDGEALEREWGGPLDADLPFHQIRISEDEGAGDPGVPTYVAAKCVYTDSDIYFLLRWTDTSPSEVANPLIYTGPDYNGAGSCEDYLVAEQNWFRAEEVQEDRLVVQFDLPDAEGASVGRRDVWEWLAGRTNVVRAPYSPDENPFFPIRGLPGYMEDALYDPAFGLFFDPGSPPWRRNFTAGSDVPTFVYRQADDPFFEPADGDECRNGFGGECLANNGLANFYIWREDGAAATDHFGSCDSLNFFPRNVVDDTDDDEPRFWRTFDAVSGYWYTSPSGSRADVRAKAVWNEGVWTLELGRPLSTGDVANDLRFTGALDSEASFTVQVYDESATVYKGSGKQVLRFAGPRAADQRRSSGEDS